MRTPIKDPVLVKWIHGTAIHEQLAFKELYNATSPYVFSILRRMLYSETIAEEALQDVFVKIWQQSHNYKSGETAPITWIYNIARQHAIAELRKRETNVNKEARPGLSVMVSRSNFTHFEKPQEELATGFERLNKTALEYITLAYCEGFSYEELSQKTQYPVNIIKDRIRKSLLTLKGAHDER